MPPLILIFPRMSFQTSLGVPKIPNRCISSPLARISAPRRRVTRGGVISLSGSWHPITPRGFVTCQLVQISQKSIFDVQVYVARTSALFLVRRSFLDKTGKYLRLLQIESNRLRFCKNMI